VWWSKRASPRPRVARRLALDVVPAGLDRVCSPSSYARGPISSSPLMLLLVQSFLLPCSAAALVGLPAGAPSRNIAMCAQDVRHLYVPDVVLDKETVAAAKVELLTDEEDWEPLEQPEAVDVGLDMQLSQQPTRAGDRDASVVQYVQYLHSSQRW